MTVGGARADAFGGKVGPRDPAAREQFNRSKDEMKKFLRRGEFIPI